MYLPFENSTTRIAILNVSGTLHKTAMVFTTTHNFSLSNCNNVCAAVGSRICRLTNFFYNFFFQANEDSISSCGKRLQTASTVSPLPPLSTKRSSVAMVDLVPISNQWSKSEGSCDQQTFLTQVLICLILVLVTSSCFSSRAETRHQLVAPKGQLISESSNSATNRRS